MNPRRSTEGTAGERVLVVVMCSPSHGWQQSTSQPRICQGAWRSHDIISLNCWSRTLVPSAGECRKAGKLDARSFNAGGKVVTSEGCRPSSRIRSAWIHADRISSVQKCHVHSDGEAVHIHCSVLVSWSAAALPTGTVIVPSLLHISDSQECSALQHVGGGTVLNFVIPLLDEV